MAKPNSSVQPSKRDVKDCTTIEPLQIQEEFVRTPGDIAYWAEQYSLALETALTAKADRDKVEAETLLRIRKDAEAQGGKVTEKVVAALVEVDPTYQDALRAEIKAAVHKDRTGGILDAVKSKRDVLQSLGAHIRHNEELTVYRDQKNRNR